MKKASNQPTEPGSPGSFFASAQPVVLLRETHDRAAAAADDSGASAERAQPAASSMLSSEGQRRFASS